MAQFESSPLTQLRQLRLYIWKRRDLRGVEAMDALMFDSGTRPRCDSRRRMKRSRSVGARVS
jgi:hypothetical protein